MKAYFGDLHNHCGISYAHGSLEEALDNAGEQLDFVSVTGHAHWPDMPERDGVIDYIIDFHEKGFAKLKQGWNSILEREREADSKGKLIIFPGFEMHSCADGDRTVICRTFDKQIIYADNLADLLRKLDRENMICFPHHVGYESGARGINWNTYDADSEPVVEIVSMHGCSESCDAPRPFLHSMGPRNWNNTILHGLNRGYIFGFLGGTDHHCACPGSYGHGASGLFAESLDRDAIFDAIRARRTWAITGDRIIPDFRCNGELLGSILPCKGKCREFRADIQAGGAIDSVDVIKNGKLFRRYCELDFPAAMPQEIVRAKIHLELGWGARHKVTPWDVSLQLSTGIIRKLEPRFRGLEVVSPVEKDSPGISHYNACHCRRTGDAAFRIQAVSEGNKTNFTPAMQGVCFEVEMPRSGVISAEINGKPVTVPLTRLLAGDDTGHLGKIDSPAYQFHRAAQESEYHWQFTFTDDDDAPGYYYLRIRQKNDQWGWTSPIFFR